MRQITLGSLFDGIGGWPFAALHAGARPAWASEIEKFPKAVTEARFPDMLQLGDIKEIDKLYNDDPFNEHNPNCSGRNTHYIIGLISSFLCNHNYEQIKGIYSELIKKTNEDAIADFQTIVDFLEKTKKELVLNTM